MGRVRHANPGAMRPESNSNSRLWGSIGWATPAAFGIALADPERRTILITGEGSHQLTSNEIGAMGRFGTNVIVFVLNKEGYLVERALEENPNWTYNDLAPWKYAELPKALGCAGWFTARVTTLGQLEHAMKSAGPQGSLWSRSDGSSVGCASTAADSAEKSKDQPGILR